MALVVTAVLGIGFGAITAAAITFRSEDVGFGQDNPCSELGSYKVEGLDPGEQLPGEDLEFDDSHVRVFPPARVCRVYAVPVEGSSLPQGSRRLIAEDPNPTAGWYVLGIIVIPLPLLIAWFRENRRNS